MFIDETIELREDLPERLWRDFAELRKYYDAGDWFNFDIFFEGLRQPSRDIIWRGKISWADLDCIFRKYGIL